MARRALPMAQKSSRLVPWMGAPGREEDKMKDAFALDAARDDMLILVDGLDREVGEATKELAHSEGLLHRAFSVVLVREGPGEDGSKAEVLLAQRAEGKYHSGGLWANSCCSHPHVGEKTVDAAYRRTQEELGCTAEGLEEIGAFVYRAEFGSGLFEYEYDHVFVGRMAGDLDPDPDEVGGTRWVTADELARLLAEEPGMFCAWAFTVLSLALRHITRR